MSTRPRNFIEFPKMKVRGKRNKQLRRDYEDFTATDYSGIADFFFGIAQSFKPLVDALHDLTHGIEQFRIGVQSAGLEAQELCPFCGRYHARGDCTPIEDEMDEAHVHIEHYRELPREPFFNVKAPAQIVQLPKED